MPLTLVTMEEIEPRAWRIEMEIGGSIVRRQSIKLAGGFDDAVLAMIEAHGKTVPAAAQAAMAPTESSQLMSSDGEDAQVATPRRQHQAPAAGAEPDDALDQLRALTAEERVFPVPTSRDQMVPELREAVDIEALRAEAIERGIKVDLRWGAVRLRWLINAASR